MRINWNIKGFEEIRRSDEIKDLVEDYADDLLAALPRGFKRSGRQGKSRYRNIIFAGTSRAFADQARNNHLQKILYERGGS